MLLASAGDAAPAVKGGTVLQEPEYVVKEIRMFEGSKEVWQRITEWY